VSIYRTYVDRSILVAALALVFCAPALPADSTWDWGYSSNQFTGSGTLTTESTLTTGLSGYTGYQIVSMSGIFDLNLITGLLPPAGYLSNDNLLGIAYDLWFFGPTSA
jgi:hypothetical protein